MKNKYIVYESTPFLERAFILEEQQMLGIKVSQPLLPKVGDIYRGKILRVVNELGLVFVDIGLSEQVGIKFKQMSFDLINQQNFSIDAQGDPICFAGQWLIVQLTQLPQKNKGYLGTTQIVLVGRYVILKFGSNRSGVFFSSSFESNHRKKQLKEKIVLESEVLLANCLIVRGNAKYVEDDNLLQECQELQHNLLEKQLSSYVKAIPELIYNEYSLAHHLLINIESGQLLKTNSKTRYEEIRNLLIGYPDLRSECFILESTSSNEREWLLEQLSQILQNTVTLHSGGNIVIEQTQAMTVIDVNTASSLSRQVKRSDINFNSNLEACEMIARQLILRNISGLIVIDFINMRDYNQKKLIRHRFQEVIQGDKHRITLGAISSFGLLELTRSKDDLSINEYLLTNCSQCATPLVQEKIIVTLHAIYLEIERFLMEKMFIRSCAIYVSNNLYQYCNNNKIKTVDILNELIQQDSTWIVDKNYTNNQYLVKIN